MEYFYWYINCKFVCGKKLRDGSPPPPPLPTPVATTAKEHC